MPISAPKPNSPPSVNRVEALTSTAAESTAAVKRRAGAWSWGRVASGGLLQDRRGVLAREAPDVGDRRLQVGYDGRRDVQREVLGRVVLLGGRDDPGLG